MSNEHHYRLSYDIKAHPAGLTPSEAEVTIPDHGLSDAMIIVSMIYPPDGSLSTAVMSKDGRTDQPLDDIEIFKAWTMLAAGLAASSTLDEGKRMLAELVIGAVRAAVTGKPMPDPTEVGRVLLGVWKEPSSEGVLKALVADLVDRDPCHYDHDGGCQAHGWDSGVDCPHARAKKLGIGVG